MNSEKFVNFACTVESVATRKDRTLKITLGSQEMNATDAAVLLSLANQLGHCYISPVALTEAELKIPDNAEFPNQKTQSERIRNALYVLWEKRGKSGDYDSFYKQQTEKFIEAIKLKLD